MLREKSVLLKSYSQDAEFSHAGYAYWIASSLQWHVGEGFSENRICFVFSVLESQKERERERERERPSVPKITILTKILSKIVISLSQAIL